MATPKKPRVRKKTKPEDRRLTLKKRKAAKLVAQGMQPREVGLTVYNTTNKDSASAIMTQNMQDPSFLSELDRQLAITCPDLDHDVATVLNGLIEEAKSAEMGAKTRMDLIMLVAKLKGYFAPTVSKTLSVKGTVAELQAATPEHILEKRRQILADLEKSGESKDTPKDPVDK